jgi:A/G-specific adenine glycosylase
VSQEKFAETLLTWYGQAARQLPWRGVRDPYGVWVSEIMLQQTRVETVIPYYQRWMKRFPDMASLAKASQQEVLSLWEGLGYYSRARNLQRAAKIVIEEMGGVMPQDVKTLQTLPGIGRYTAGAIASIAFGKDEAALDGNIRRVLARYFNVTEVARSPAGERILWDLAARHLPSSRAGEYNQAMMDLGALICTARSPDCQRCPLAKGCQARRLGIQEERPVTRAKSPIPHYTVTAAVICQPARRDRVLISQRPEDGLLGGLWEFPGGKQQDNEVLSACLKREILEELGVEIQVCERLGVYQHAYTHFRVTLHAFHCKLPNGAQPKPIQVQDLKWATLDDLIEFPMGKIDRQIATELVEREKLLC